MTAKAQEAMRAANRAAKLRYPHAQALVVAESLRAQLEPVCDKLMIVGSLRRKKPMVSDVELGYSPRFQIKQDPLDMFATVNANLADEVIAKWEHDGLMGRRTNALGLHMFGPKNKLMLHIPTGIPVDLFSTTSDCFVNYIGICRTGGHDFNLKVCVTAQDRGWKWLSTGNGFQNVKTGEVRLVTVEQDLFDFLGWPYLAPEDRV